MAETQKSIATYALDGTQLDFPIPFEYLARKFIVVTLMGDDTTPKKTLVLTDEYRFTSATQITLNSLWGPGNGYNLIEIRRVTSATDRLVNFSDGSILRAYDLNTSQIQAIHISEEARDVSSLALIQDLVSWNAVGRRIRNVANPILAQDAATKNYVDTVSATEGSRAVRGQPGETLSLLPSASLRASKVLGFDSLGNPTVMIPQDGSGASLAVALKDPANDLVAFKRSKLATAIDSSKGMLSGLRLNAWEYMPLGLVYNPTSDPATWPNISLGIAAASAVLAARGGGSLTVPYDKYRLNTGVSLPPNVKLYCEQSLLYFYGTGRAISMDCGTKAGGGIYDATLVAKGTGQHGVYMQGSFPELTGFCIQDFEGESLRVGDVTVAACQWGTFNRIQILNNGSITGARGIIVDGAFSGLNPNSNLNTFSNIMVSGSFTTHVEDKGNDNKWPSLNMAWRNATGRTIMRIRGGGAELLKPYVESADGTLPALVFNMESTSNRVNIVRPNFVFAPGVGRNMDDYIKDDGVGNEHPVPARGIDIGGTGNRNSPSVNLFANGLFKTWGSATTPKGGRGASPTITRSPETYMGGYSIQFNDVAGNSSISFDLTPSGSSLVNHPIVWLMGKTLTVGSWVWSNYPGPMIKVFAESGNTASSGEHTGNGTWQFLVATIKIGVSATSVFVQMRSNSAGGGVNTGTARFNAVAAVVGNNIPSDLIRGIPESGGAVNGVLSFQLDSTNFADSAFPDVHGWFLWPDSTGKWRTSNTKPTVRDSGTVVGSQT